MMFCGVDALEDINNEVLEDQEDPEVQYAKEFIMRKARIIVEKRKRSI
jgi:hypothetical protein